MGEFSVFGKPGMIQGSDLLNEVARNTDNQQTVKKGTKVP